MSDPYGKQFKVRIEPTLLDEFMDIVKRRGLSNQGATALWMKMVVEAESDKALQSFLLGQNTQPPWSDGGDSAGGVAGKISPTPPKPAPRPAHAARRSQHSGAKQHKKD